MNPVKYSHPALADVSLRQFSIDFLTFCGVCVRKENRRKNGVISAELTEALSTYFETDSLRLCFEHADAEEGCELVAYGSRMFDQMIAYLQERSASTLLLLPKRHTSSDELMRAIRPRNASITNLRMRDTVSRHYIFNWQLTFRSDEVSEEIYTVVLDSDGERVMIGGESAAGDSWLDLSQWLADGESVSLEASQQEDGVDAKLPPMTHLVAMAETARKYAIYHADLQCVDQEAEILPRLYRTLNRITTYYGQQIEEVYDTHDRDGEKRRVLEEDLERKIAEEVENHRLRVGVELFSYAVVQTPVAVSEMSLSDGKQEVELAVELDRYTGLLKLPRCHSCKQETADVVIDKNGHITCDDCVEQCSTCAEVVCSACGVEACPVCSTLNCSDCGESCWACGERACPDHIDSCPVCGDRVCHSCQDACSECGVRQCRSHLLADALPDDEGNYQLICEECAVRCPGCQQYSAQVGACTASGQRFCENCLVECSQCGQVYGPGFYQTSATGQVLCVNCLHECPSCGTLTTDIMKCDKCGAEYCASCGRTCDLCDAHCCEGHYQRFETCGHTLCEEHMAVCESGGETVCAICSDVCGICEMPVCEEHSARCHHCGQRYCASCVSAFGFCSTCETLAAGDGVPVKLAEEPCAADLEVASMARHYTWTRAGNQRFIIYNGRNRLMGGAVIVVDTAGGADNVVDVRRMGLLETLHERIYRLKG